MLIDSLFGNDFIVRVGGLRAGRMIFRSVGGTTLEGYSYVPAWRSAAS